MSHKKNKKKERIKRLVYIFLSFVLSVCLFFLSLSLIIRVTIFSPDFMKNAMSSTAYYQFIKEEFADKLKNLGHASGLSDDFVDKFVEDFDFIEIESEYVDAFYSEGSTLVNTTKFKQSMLSALEAYIEENNIDKSKASEANLIYLVDKASEIYVAHVTVPFFSVIGNYIKKLDVPLRIAEIAFAVLSAGIIAIIYFTNEYKHRRYRYICYGTTGAALTVAVIPAVVGITGIVGKASIGTRSLYNLFVSYFSSFFNYFWAFAGVLAFFSVVAFIVFYTRFKKAIS